MAIYLGNLTVKELESEHSFSLSDADRETLESMRQDNAYNIDSEEFHIFDFPRTIACGSKDTALKVYNILKHYSIKGQFGISVIQ